MESPPLTLQTQKSIPLNQQAAAPLVTPTNCPPSVVTVPIPVIPPAEGTYAYIAVKSSLYASDSAVFGLNADEIRALSNRHSLGSTYIENGILLKAPAMPVINTLSQLGYKVCCTTGETEIVWTMQREI